MFTLFLLFAFARSAFSVFTAVTGTTFSSMIPDKARSFALRLNGLTMTVCAVTGAPSVETTVMFASADFGESVEDGAESTDFDRSADFLLFRDFLDFRDVMLLRRLSIALVIGAVCCG